MMMMNMKKYSLLFLGIFFAGALTSCSNDDEMPVITIPVIESSEITSGDSIILGDSLYFRAVVNDTETPLSTLEVELTNGDMTLAKKSIRTKGNRVSLENVSLFVPFAPGIRNDDKLTLKLTLINVDGGEAKVEKTIRAVRPELPDTLYIVLSDKSVIELYATDKNLLVYESAEGVYKNAFSAKIATAKDPLEAVFVWNGGIETNSSVIGDPFGSDVRFSYTNWLVKKIRFDALNFTLDMEGQSMLIRVNGVLLVAAGDYLHAEIEFTENQTFTIEGIENPEDSYNRDFFVYDPENDSYTFTGKSGKWDVFYSLSYDYFWVNRMNDTAPNTYWIIGAGHTSVPRWYPDFNDMGWDLDDVKQVAYMKKIGTGLYQASVYLSDQVPWGFDIQVYSNRTWNAEFAVFSNDRITGDKEGIRPAGSSMADIVMDEGFVPGYYRITMDITEGLSNAKMNFERLTSE
jgi:hypothetical protein